MNTTVMNYGVHQSPDGLTWLLQDGSAQNARDLKVKCPIKVTAPRGTVCPHAIDLGVGEPGAGELQFVERIAADPLTSAFLPLPGRKAFFFVTDEGERLQVLQDLFMLSSPQRGYTQPAWLLSPAESKNFPSTTNIMPFLIFGVKVKWLAREADMVETFRYGTRPLILVGDRDCVLPSWVERPSTKLLDELKVKETEALNLKHAGAWTLRQFMRGEWNSEIIKSMT